MEKKASHIKITVLKCFDTKARALGLLEFGIELCPKAKSSKSRSIRFFAN